MNFIQDERKKCMQMRQDIENFEVMQICMRNELFKSNTIFTAYRVSIVTHNELRTSAPKSFDEVWVQDNTASLSIERDEKRPFNCYNLRFPWF